MDLPLVVFEYPPASGIGYSPETLAELCKIPTVVGGQGLVERHRGLREEPARAARLGPAGGHALVLHHVADGELPARRRRLHLGHGQRGRRSAGRRSSRPSQSRRPRDGARAINERLAPLVSVFYAPPFVDMHNRMKEALVILGRIPAAYVRPPLTPVSEDERHRIRLALRDAGLL